ncbi:hypothetical protein RSAG8_02229, partial [Rhizoctonia solani AG-8 WAC10335]
MLVTFSGRADWGEESGHTSKLPRTADDPTCLRFCDSSGFRCQREVFPHGLLLPLGLSPTCE